MYMGGVGGGGGGIYACCLYRLRKRRTTLSFDSKQTNFNVVLGSQGKSVSPIKRNSLLITKRK